MALVYIHKKLTDNSIYYVGISKNEKRAYNKWGRSNIWKRYYAKYGLKVDIICKDISLDEAKKIEIFLIKSYGRIDNNTGILCNMTDGGDGATSRVITDEYRRMLIDNYKPRKPRIGYKHSEYTKSKIGESNSKCVIQFDLKGIMLSMYDSLADAYRITGVRQGNIYSVCIGDRNTAGGFKWKYNKI